MPKYISQRRKTSCVPAAIINASKWGGINLTKKHHYSQLCSELIVNNGTPTSKIKSNLQKYLGKKIDIQEKNSTSVLETYVHLKYGGSIILTFYNKSKNKIRTHCIFISGIYENKNPEKDKWVIHNLHFKRYGNGTSYISDKTMKDILVRTNNLWFLNKKNTLDQ